MNWQHWTDHLEAPVDGLPLALFRFLFGAVIFIYTLVKARRTLRYFCENPFFFHWELFSWLRPLSRRGWLALTAVQAVAALFVSLGFCYPFSLFVVLGTYTYTFLLDKVLYNNHEYLVLLLLFLLGVTDGAANFSLDVFLGLREGGPSIPYWQILIFQVQILIVFTWGGINKLHWDWMVEGQPMRYWFQTFRGRTQWEGNHRRYCLTPSLAKGVEKVFQAYPTALFFSWGGALVDLFVIWGLLSDRFFIPALCIYLSFNLFNQWFFNIGKFPWMNYAYLVLFISAETHRKWLACLEGACLGG